MMECSACGWPVTHVLDSRVTIKNEIWRRRQCARCKDRVTTYERVDYEPGPTPARRKAKCA